MNNAALSKREAVDANAPNGLRAPLPEKKAAIYLERPPVQR